MADLDVGLEVLVLLRKLVLEVDPGSGQPLLADVLVIGVQSVLDLGQAVGDQIVQQVMVDSSLLEGELGLANLGNDGVDELDDLHVGPMLLPTFPARMRHMMAEENSSNMISRVV